MPRYLIHANYTPEGAKALLSEGGVSRRAVAEGLIRSLDGTLEAFYFALGSTDVFAIYELPDNVSAAAAGLVVSASGAIRSSTTVLLTPEEIDAATKLSPVYRAPGT